MATVFEANHDAGGNVSDYWTTVLGGAKLSITVGAALDGSARGVNVEFGTSDNKQVLEPVSAPGTNELRLRWFFDTNGIVYSGAGTITVALTRIRTGGSLAMIQAKVTLDNAGNFRLLAEKIDDPDVTLVGIFDIAIIDAAHCVEFRIVRESSSSGFDGQRQIYLDGVLQSDSNNVQNFTRFNNLDAIHSTWTTDTNVSGDMYADEYILDNDADANLGCQAGPVTNEWTAAAMKKPCSISMDGDKIFIAALNNLGQPVLIDFSSDLSSDGNVVFSPGSGDDIGVQCGRRDSNVVWIGGEFGGGDVLEKSEDGGATWGVRDPGTFDPVVAFNVSPESDEHVLIATNAGGSAASGTLQLTLDDGDSWQQVNSNTGSAIRDIQQLDKNPQEVALGGETPEELDYSINTGANLEDYSSGLPATDVNKLIVG